MSTGFICTTLDGDPAACAATATFLEQTRDQLRDTARDVDDTVTTSGATRWQGQAAAAWQGIVRGQTALLADDARRFEQVRIALCDLARALECVGGLLSVAREVARQGGLQVSHDGFWEPNPSLPANGSAGAESVRAAAWQRASRLVAEARAGEDEAHAAVLRRLAAADGISVLDELTNAVILLPPPGGDVSEYTAWGLGVAGSATAMATSPHGSAWLSRQATALEKQESGMARTAAAGLRGESTALKSVAKEAGLAGDMLTVGLSGRDQWRADADDERLSNADRVGRAVVRGAIEGGFTIGGTAAGAAALSWVPVIGTAVGGAAGGYVGGKAGGFVADIAVEQVDEVIDVAEDVGETIGDVTDGAVDTAKDVGEKVCFWD